MRPDYEILIYILLEVDGCPLYLKSSGAFSSGGRAVS